MNPDPSQFKRLFTVEQANAMLPLVRAICQDLAALAREVIERQQRLSLLMAGRAANHSDLYSEELVQIQEELQRDKENVNEYVQELRDLGVEVKGAVDGLVDFPSLMDERVVYLCWKLDEPEVLHWHELNAGFSGRQSLTAASGATSGGLSQQAEDL